MKQKMVRFPRFVDLLLLTAMLGSQMTPGVIRLFKKTLSFFHFNSEQDNGSVSELK